MSEIQGTAKYETENDVFNLFDFDARMNPPATPSRPSTT